MTAHDQMTRIALALTLILGLAGCGGADTAPSLGVAEAGLTAANGLSPNGLSRNGLSRNGLSRNGLSRNGLSRNGLLNAEFQAWFAEDPATSAAVMSYLARCAVPAGKSLTYTSPTSGTSYSWSGSLGLAPGWASGLEATVAEEQIITACLAAHVNRYGSVVSISVLGQGATGLPIPIGRRELTTYAQREGCFFGNLFADEGVYAGLDHDYWTSSTSSARACTFDLVNLGPSADCAPINNVGACRFICKPDASGTSYTSCGTWVNGAWRSYLPITTRLLPADVYTCGDGTCQFTERCGDGTTTLSCQADCGACPVATTAPTGTDTAKSTTTTTRKR